MKKKLMSTIIVLSFLIGFFVLSSLRLGSLRANEGTSELVQAINELKAMIDELDKRLQKVEKWTQEKKALIDVIENPERTNSQKLVEFLNGMEITRVENKENVEITTKFLEIIIACFNNAKKDFGETKTFNFREVHIVSGNKNFAERNFMGSFNVSQSVTLDKCYNVLIGTGMERR